MKTPANPAPFDAAHLGGDTIEARILREFGALLRAGNWSCENGASTHFTELRQFVESNMAAVVSGLTPDVQPVRVGKWKGCYLAELAKGKAFYFSDDFTLWIEKEGARPLQSSGLAQLFRLLNDGYEAPPYALAQLLGVAAMRALKAMH